MTNDARRTREIKYGVATSKTAFYKKKALFTKKFDLNIRKRLVKFNIWSTALCGAESWTLRKVDQIYVEGFEMCWRRMEKISWTGRLKNEVLHGQGGGE